MLSNWGHTNRAVIWYNEDYGVSNKRVCKYGCKGNKKAATERLICKYDVILCLFMELNFNWSKDNSSANLTSWFTDKERKMRCAMTHNLTKMDALFRKH
jgi:hypothetical protein